MPVSNDLPNNIWRRVRLDRQTRPGYLMLELTAATVLLCVMLGMFVQAVAWTSQERRSIDRRAVALQEAANLLDQLTELPWSELTPERAKLCGMSAEAAAILPRATLEVALGEPTGEPPARRVAISLHWQGDHGQDDGPVRLTAWTYRRAEAEQ